MVRTRKATILLIANSPRHADRQPIAPVSLVEEDHSKKLVSGAPPRIWRRSVQRRRPQQLQLGFLRRDPPLKHHPARARDGGLVAVPRRPSRWSATNSSRSARRVIVVAYFPFGTRVYGSGEDTRTGETPGMPRAS